MATRITTSWLEDGIKLLTISCPERRNILDEASYAQMNDVLAAVEEDARAKALIITGTENCFTAGNDLANYQTMTDAAPAIGFLRQLNGFSKPVIAAVEGIALDIGSTLLLHCDFAYAGESTKFSFPFINFSLTPHGASTYLLPRLAGNKIANEMLLLGHSFTALRALEIGLITDTTPDSKALDQAIDCATKLANKSCEAVVATKALMRSNDSETIDQILRKEEATLLKRCQSSEAQTAFEAFFNRKNNRR